MLEVPTLGAASTFVVGSLDTFSACVTSAPPVTAASAAVGDKALAAVAFVVDAAGAWPAQVFSAGLLLLGAALMLFGYKMVRPVNFAAGAYLGGTLSLLLLNIFQPSLDSCGVIVGIGAACGLLLGTLCALKRSSVLTVLGLVAGEILGDVVYKSFLAPSGAPEYAAFFCIGFAAVLLGVLVAHVGDFMVKVSCAFFGAYMVVTNALKLAAPLTPEPSALLAFNAFKPQLSQALDKPTAASLGSPYILGPAVMLLLLTLLGTYVQVRLLKAAQTPSDMESLIRK